VAKAHSISFPMVSTSKLSQFGDLFSHPTLYHSVIDALHYAILTIPDITFVVNKVRQFMAKPLKSPLAVVK